MGTLAGVIGSSKKTIDIIDHSIVQILPLAPVNTVKNHALLGFGKTIDFIYYFSGKQCEVAPADHLFTLIQAAEVRTADNFFLSLFRMPGNRSTPDYPQWNSMPVRKCSTKLERNLTAQGQSTLW